MSCVQLVVERLLHQFDVRPLAGGADAGGSLGESEFGALVWVQAGFGGGGRVHVFNGIWLRFSRKNSWWTDFLVDGEELLEGAAVGTGEVGLAAGVIHGDGLAPDEGGGDGGETVGDGVEGGAASAFGGAGSGGFESVDAVGAEAGFGEGLLGSHLLMVKEGGAGPTGKGGGSG